MAPVSGSTMNMLIKSPIRMLPPDHGSRWLSRKRSTRRCPTSPKVGPKKKADVREPRRHIPRSGVPGSQPGQHPSNVD